MTTTLTINPELRDLLPPLSPKQFGRLEAEIIRDGCTTPLTVWNDTIIDGHNRYVICTRHNISFQKIQTEFSSLDEAKLWMWTHQDGRRNLTRFGRVEFALKIKDVIATQSKERQRAAGGDRKSDRKKSLGQNSAQAISSQKRTRQQIADFAGVSHDTVDRVEFLLTHANADTINALRWEAKETSINKEFTRLKAELDAKKPAKPKQTKTFTSSTTPKTASKEAQSESDTKSTQSASSKTQAKSKTQATFTEATDTTETENPIERPTVIAPLWKGVKEQQTYSCGVRFEPDPDDDFFDWITREEREEMRKQQEESPALKLVPLIRNYTIQSIPEHDPQYLVSCLFSLFQPLYREKLLYALARKMLAKNEAEAVRKFLATLTDECQS